MSFFNDLIKLCDNLKMKQYRKHLKKHFDFDQQIQKSTSNGDLTGKPKIKKKKFQKLYMVKESYS